LSAVKKFVYVVISASLIVSCNIGELEFDDIELTPVKGPFAFTLGETEYVMRDLIGNQTGDSLDFQEDSLSLLTLLYYDTITYSTPDDLIQIDDIVSNGDITPPTTTIPVGTGPTVLNSSYPFDGFEYNPTNGEQLDSIFYEQGDLTIECATNINATVTYTFTFPSTTNVASGAPISVTGTIIGDGTLIQDTETRTLVGHKTELTDASGDNRYSVDLDLEIDLAAGQDTDGTEIFNFDITFGNQEFSLIYGKFGQDTVQVGDQSLEIDFFTQAARDGITFGNPTMTFDFRNSFGVPVEADFSGLNGQDAEGNQVFLTGEIINNPPLIASSDVNSPGINTPGEVAQTVIEIDRTNSNLVNVLSSSPEQLNFNVVGRSNPDDVNTLNYLQPDDSEITAYVTLEVPMEVQLEDYTETGSYSVGEGFNANNLDSAFIRIVTLNELPFTGTVSMEVQAADSTVLFPITDETDPRYDSALAANPGQIERFTNIPAIKAPLISVNGDVTDPSGETEDIGLTNEEVQLLSTAGRVVITMTLNTPVSQTSRDIYVRVLADYTLELKVGVGGRFNLDLLEYD